MLIKVLKKRDFWIKIFFSGPVVYMLVLIGILLVRQEADISLARNAVFALSWPFFNLFCLVMGIIRKRIFALFSFITGCFRQLVTKEDVPGLFREIGDSGILIKKYVKLWIINFVVFILCMFVFMPLFFFFALDNL